VPSWVEARALEPLTVGKGWMIASRMPPTIKVYQSDDWLIHVDNSSLYSNKMIFYPL
jgi:hypothetical protein